MSKQPESVTRQIPVEAVLPPEFNSRTTRVGPAGEAQQKTYEELLASMDDPKNGQLQAIEVEEFPAGHEHAGKYLLVIGSRRLSVAKALKWETIRAEVKPYTSIVDRILRNGEENLRRDGLTDYETARYLAALRENGMSADQAAKRLKMSESQLRNLTVGLTLPPFVLKQWEAGHPALTNEFVRDLARGKVEVLVSGKMLAAKTPELKEAAFQARAAQIAAANAEGKKRVPSHKQSGGGSTAKLPISHARFQRALDFVKNKKTPLKVGEGNAKEQIRTLLDWIVQARDKAPQLIQDQIDAEKAAKEEEAA